MVKIVPTHPYLVSEYQEVIMTSVNDHDISIRMRALDLISAMVGELLPRMYFVKLTLSTDKPPQLTVNSTAAVITLGS
jgi:hypothetical protein